MTGAPLQDDAPDDMTAAVVSLAGVTLRHRDKVALDDVTLALPAGTTAAFIGPDGVGKSSLLSIIAGARAVPSGTVYVLGGDMRSARHRNAVCPRIAYMPQGLGRNLYPTLSVHDNVDFFARLYGHGRDERQRRIGELLEATGLAPFATRPAGKLSGGMKQKLGLCCALIHDPDLLVLDEPTTGVDPLSRRQFWGLVDRIRSQRPGIGVLVATAYMEEVERFDWLVAMHAGRVLATGHPTDLLARAHARTLEEAFLALLPEAVRADHRPLPRTTEGPRADAEIAIEAQHLTMRFGDFVAVEDVSFRIRRGEIFGFIGSNGCGKTTTMKMLTGLLPASEGQAFLLGHPVNAHDLDTRRRVGYMTQSFSLFGELTVRQNLVLHARLFDLPAARIPERVREMGERFGLAEVMDTLPGDLPLGHRQRLSLAVAMIHGPEMLILDEPTSGVDPVARDEFWRIMLELARSDHVTIFISTHFMNEAERCDRISLMHAGRVLVSDTPAALIAARRVDSLEEAFVAYLEDATGERVTPPAAVAVPTARPERKPSRRGWMPDARRMLSYTRRETLELWRDPIRLTLAGLGSVILMLVLAYGVSMDVEDLSFAVLDHDRTALSRDYALNLSGSRYFLAQPPLRDYEDLDRRMREGRLSLAVEIPPGFARDVARGHAVQVGAWIDGAMPQRAETVQGYVQGMHAQWLTAQATASTGVPSAAVNVETRFRYNPDVRSLPAMAPAVIPLLLMLIPSMLAALSVVREKELGSIVNLYVTPVTKLEFLLGKQLPYIGLALVNFLLLTAVTVVLFRVPLKGSFAALSLAALLYVIAATGLGLVISAFVRSQVAAIFGTAVLTLLPAVQFSGMINPVSSLEGMGAFIGQAYPTTHLLTIARGTFSKALGFADLRESFIPLCLAAPILIALGALLLKKQDR